MLGRLFLSRCARDTMEKRDRKMCNLFSSLRLIYRNMFIFLLHSRESAESMEKRANELFSLYFFRRKQEHSRSCCFLWLCGTFSFSIFLAFNILCKFSFKTFSGWRAAQFSLFFSIVQQARLLKFMNGCWSLPMNAKWSSGCGYSGRQTLLRN